MALCVDCRRNKTFERQAERCSDCEAAREAREPRPAPPAGDGDAESATAGVVTPGSLLGLGLVLQLVGGLVLWSSPDGGGGGGGFAAGVLLAWAGGLVLLVALIAFGVRIGIQAAAADDVRR